MWSDTFDISPWAGGYAERGTTYVPSEEIRNKLRARRARLEAEGAEGYANPWQENSAAAKAAATTNIEEKVAEPEITEPLTDPEKEQTAARGGAKKKAAKSTKPSVWKPIPSDIPVENLAIGVIKVIGDGLGISKSNDIPVEDLTNGVINILGDGLGVVIHTGATVGGTVANGVQAGARTVITNVRAGARAVGTGTMVGLVVGASAGTLYDFSGILTGLGNVPWK